MSRLIRDTSSETYVVNPDTRVGSSNGLQMNGFGGCGPASRARKMPNGQQTGRGYCCRERVGQLRSDTDALQGSRRVVFAALVSGDRVVQAGSSALDAVDVAAGTGRSG